MCDECKSLRDENKQLLDRLEAAEKLLGELFEMTDEADPNSYAADDPYNCLCVIAGRLAEWRASASVRTALRPEPEVNQ